MVASTIKNTFSLELFLATGVLVDSFELDESDKLSSSTVFSASGVLLLGPCRIASLLLGDVIELDSFASFGFVDLDSTPTDLDGLDDSCGSESGANVIDLVEPVLAGWASETTGTFFSSKPSLSKGESEKLV